MDADQRGNTLIRFDSGGSNGDAEQHANVRMTLRYTHLGDREIEAVAERVGQAIGAIMDI